LPITLLRCHFTATDQLLCGSSQLVDGIRVASSIAGCWLLVAGCWLLAAGCWLLAAGCWLLVDISD